MANPYAPLRYKNVFGPSGYDNGGMAQPGTLGGAFEPPKNNPFQNISFGSTNFEQLPQPQPTVDDDPISALRNLNLPHVAQDRFTELQSRYPQYEPPSFGRAVGASLASFGKGGTEEANRLMGLRNARNFADWKAQIEPAYQSANLERQGNINERQLAYNMATTQLGMRKAEETERKNRELEAARDKRNAINDFRARNPNMVIKAIPGGNVIAIDPSPAGGGRSVTITDSQGRPVSSGDLTDTERINLEGQWRVRAARETGANQQALERMRQSGYDKAGNELYEEEAPDGSIRYWIQNPRTGRFEQTEPTGPGTEIPSGQRGPIRRPGTTTQGGSEDAANRELEQSRRRLKEAYRIMSEDDDADKFIQIVNGQVEMDEPSAVRTWMNPELLNKYKTWYQRIYGPQEQPLRSGGPGGGKGRGPAAVPETPGAPIPRGGGRGAPPTTQKPTGGTVKMIAPDGTPRDVPLDSVALAERQGFKRQ